MIYYYPENYGAKGDGTTNDREALQASIDDCEKNGGGTVVLESGKIYYTDSLRLKKNVELHLQKEHPQRLEELLEQEKKLLSLTDKQEQLLLLFSQGISDQEIARQNGTVVSTVRHQRFVFRERAKAAKIYLAAWEMMQQGRSAFQGHEELISIHGGATMVDSRYEITQQEEQKILQGAFSSLDPLRLKTFSPKEKKKIVILRRIAQQFTAGQRYTEKQVNEVLKGIFDDYVTLRRYLIEYGFLKREKDGSAYWKEQE